MNLSPIISMIDDKIPLRLRMAGATLSGRIVSSIGAFAGIFLAAVVTVSIGGSLGFTYLLIAPIGASAVLAFAVPSSPLAQPWSVVGGNFVSALIGMIAASAIPATGLAGALAVAGAILAMTLTRSLHPPGGACALVMVLASRGDTDSLTGLFVSLVLNSLVLVCVAAAFHRVFGRSYPHRVASFETGTDYDELLHPDDIREALGDLGEVFDVTDRDLDAIFRRAQFHRSRRLSRTPGFKKAA